MGKMRREPAGTPHGGRFAKGIGLSDEDIEAIQWEVYERENERLAREESGDDSMSGVLGENTPEF
ncbi:hypothetical protein [Bifidobacterium pseudocatenulatum]|uniref:hypothetical protein n=1 Tax=Bifidobacterium pseudocatenulatum TaxID=28026 RepID=UPI001D01A45E|nr:hypothetical protein [Bifidobacterium pseudocatenulatum]UDG85698.1 hypothetical protein KYE72_05170 [Bifidobacterium pseudocatenulatum]